MKEPMFSGNRIKVKEHTLYKVIKSPDEETFELTCMKMIDDDWDPIGGVSYNPDCGFIQSFMRTEVVAEGGFNG